jgi:hypothetical protein
MYARLAALSLAHARQTTLQPPAGDTRSAARFGADCAAGVGLASCSAPAMPKDCPAGQHWSAKGGIAHCVDNDPPCAAPNHIEKDDFGNPRCAIVTYSYEYKTSECASGYSGSGKHKRRKVTVDDGVTSYGSWTSTSNDCTKDEPRW